MKEVVGAICIVIGVVLVAVDVLDWAVTKFGKKDQGTTTVSLTAADGTVGTYELPGEGAIKALIDKAPRLGAALAFLILGSVLNEWLALSAAVA